MIDITKNYKTRNGHSVVCLSYVPYNSCGDKVTFPIKGSIIIKGKRSPIFQIWKEDGSNSVFGEHKFDLILV